MNIALASDNNYMQHLGIALTSILINLPKSKELNVYLLSSDITIRNRKKIDRLKEIRDFNLYVLDDIDTAKYDRINKTRHTINTFLRLRLPEILSNVDKIIYFDCDMIIRYSIEELWNIDIGKNILGACLDSYSLIEKEGSLLYGKDYINAGMLIMNLREMRENKVEDDIIHWLSINNNRQMPDQDAINAVLKNDIVQIPYEWNYQYPMFNSNDCVIIDPKILHYTTKNKPWNLYPDFKWKREYLKYKKMSPWRSCAQKNISFLNLMKYFFSMLIKTE